MPQLVKPQAPASFPKSRSPSAWEQGWQQILDFLYTDGLARFGRQWVAGASQTTSQPAFPYSADERARMIESLIFNHRTLCELQRDLQSVAGDLCIVNFEDDWRAAGPTTREKHYFEAMRHVCAIPDMEAQRYLAPEISLNRFQDRNGQGYLDLLRSLIPEQIPPNQYVRLDHPIVDALLASGIQAQFETVEAVPTDREALELQDPFSVFVHITRSLAHPLLSFYGRTQNTTFTRTGGNSLTPRQLAELEKSGMSSAAIRTLKREHREVQKRSQWVCESCRKPESHFPKGKLRSCSKCVTADRYVMYCSRDCQAKDRKNGNPPHKTICGKLACDIPMPWPLAPPMTKANCSTVPPPIGSYRRSIALVHQISLLEQQPTIDYFLIQPAPLPNFCICISDPTLKEFFRANRNRAFQTGDSAAVDILYAMLEKTAKSRTVSGVSTLKKQLEAEFGKNANSFSKELSTTSILECQTQTEFSGFYVS